MVNYIKEQVKKLHINLKDEQCEQLFEILQYAYRI